MGTSVVSGYADVLSAGLRNGYIMAVCGRRATHLIYVFHYTFFPLPDVNVCLWMRVSTTLAGTPDLFESVIHSPGFSILAGWKIFAGTLHAQWLCVCVCVLDDGEAERTWKTT